ncbi:hypothetical protein OAZ24_05305 [Synechococcus sp. AH-736-G21]|nr:hypothetical protein [Synechococcus sp. AH-736-G21]
MAYSELEGTFFYGDGDYFTFEGIMDDLWGGGTYRKRQVIRPLEYPDSLDIPFSAYNVAPKSRIRLTSVKNFRGDLPYSKDSGLTITSYYDSKSGETNTDIDPPGQFSYGHGLTFDDMEATAFYKQTGYRFDTEKSIDFPGKSKGTKNSNDTQSDSPEEDSNRSNKGKTVLGNNKNNRLNGSKYDDVIFGYEGHDKIKGKKGDDIIDPGKRTTKKPDIVSGGKGADTYIIGNGYWAIIQDFSIADDTLDLTNLSSYSIEYRRNDNLTYVFGDDGYEVVRLSGKVSEKKMNIIS